MCQDVKLQLNYWGGYWGVKIILDLSSLSSSLGAYNRIMMSDFLTWLMLVEFQGEMTKKSRKIGEREREIYNL